MKIMNCVPQPITLPLIFLGNIPPLQVPGALPFTGTPPLTYSDNPERLTWDDGCINGDTEGVLWTHYVPSNMIGHHRVFLWHQNEIPAVNALAITIENRGTQAISIPELYITTCSSGSGWDFGRQMALSVLTGNYTTRLDGPGSVGPNTIALLAELSPPYNQGVIRGAQVDIVLNNVANNKYCIRVLYGQSQGNWKSITGNPPTIWKDRGNTHPRGSWPWSEASQQMSYTTSLSNCYMLVQPNVVFSANTSSALEACVCSPDPVQGGVDCAHDNPGAFGAVIHCQLDIWNDEDCDKLVRLFIMPRGGDLAGAVRLKREGREFIPAQITGIMRVPRTNPPTFLCTDLGTYQIQKGTNNIFNIDWAISGLSATPLAIAALTSW